MNGEHHILITALSITLLLAPWIECCDFWWLFALYTGIFIGSIAPDADTEDATILHGLKSGKNVVRRLQARVSLILPIIGYVIRYLIYYPVSGVIYILTGGSVKPHHRGLLHSVPGILIISVILTGAMWAAAMLTGYGGTWLILTLGAGFLTGCLFHLLEDSCTKSGICWRYPFNSARIRGNIVTGKRLEKRPELLAGMLGGATVLFLVAEPVFGLSPDILRVLSAATLIIIWIGFLKSAGINRS